MSVFDNWTSEKVLRVGFPANKNELYDLKNTCREKLQELRFEIATWEETARQVEKLYESM